MVVCSRPAPAVPLTPRSPLCRPVKNNANTHNFSRLLLRTTGQLRSLLGSLRGSVDQLLVGELVSTCNALIIARVMAKFLIAYVDPEHIMEHFAGVFLALSCVLCPSSAPPHPGVRPRVG